MQSVAQETSSRGRAMSTSINAENLMPGEHLVTPRRGYTHHGIYAGNGRVIHYAGLSRSLRRGPVEEVTLHAFAHGHEVWVKPEPHARFAGPEVVRRATSRLGENRYRLTTNNCEHFCSWCYCNESRSEQIDGWIGWLRRMGLASYRSLHDGERVHAVVPA
jgi:hypothetical protein